MTIPNSRVSNGSISPHTSRVKYKACGTVVFVSANAVVVVVVVVDNDLCSFSVYELEMPIINRLRSDDRPCSTLAVIR